MGLPVRIVASRWGGGRVGDSCCPSALLLVSLRLSSGSLSARYRNRPKKCPGRDRFWSPKVVSKSAIVPFLRGKSVIFVFRSGSRFPPLVIFLVPKFLCSAACPLHPRMAPHRAPRASYGPKLAGVRQPSLEGMAQNSCERCAEGRVCPLGVTPLDPTPLGPKPF